VWYLGDLPSSRPDRNHGETLSHVKAQRRMLGAPQVRGHSGPRMPTPCKTAPCHATAARAKGSCSQARAIDEPQAMSAHGYQRSLTSTPRQQASGNIIPGRRISAPPTSKLVMPVRSRSPAPPRNPRPGGTGEAKPAIVATRSVACVPAACPLRARSALRRVLPRLLEGSSHGRRECEGWLGPGLLDVGPDCSAGRGGRAGHRRQDAGLGIGRVRGGLEHAIWPR